MDRKEGAEAVQSACSGGSGWRFGAGQGLSAPEVEGLYRNWGEVCRRDETWVRRGSGGGRAVGGVPLKPHAGRGLAAHIKHLIKFCDAGRVEAQRLVKVLRALPSRKERHAKQGEVGAGR